MVQSDKMATECYYHIISNKKCSATFSVTKTTEGCCVQGKCYRSRMKNEQPQRLKVFNFIFILLL